jgi:hypothetical protein
MDKRRCNYSSRSPRQISRKLRQPVILIIGEPIDDSQVLAFHVADLFQALAKCPQSIGDRVR